MALRSVAPPGRPRGGRGPQRLPRHLRGFRQHRAARPTAALGPERLPPPRRLGVGTASPFRGHFTGAVGGSLSPRHREGAGRPPPPPGVAAIGRNGAAGSQSGTGSDFTGGDVTAMSRSGDGPRRRSGDGDARGRPPVRPTRFSEVLSPPPLPPLLSPSPEH